MITYNLDLAIILFLCVVGLNALASIPMGIAKNGESKTWDTSDSVSGVIIIAVLIIPVFF